MQNIDLDFICNFRKNIDRILIELQNETRPRLIRLANKIIKLEQIRRMEGVRDDIYFSKKEIAEELGCSVKTLTRDITILTDKGAITKRLSTYHNGERAIGNSLFIKVLNLEASNILGQKKEGLEKLLKSFTNLLQT